ncbi:hypothetical protein CEXT_435461 [Caerostris extrusa]|uniref:Uncharacterized protein n=1 Tax=Caerostris extrusa TaxID=172846 RepID=A0AAV4R2F6_CAEEX|nr:hypothetical protein CEXT_435461 [Caerostris extrusa]
MDFACSLLSSSQSIFVAILYDQRQPTAVNVFRWILIDPKTGRQLLNNLFSSSSNLSLFLLRSLSSHSFSWDVVHPPLDSFPLSSSVIFFPLPWSWVVIFPPMHTQATFSYPQPPLFTQFWWAPPLFSTSFQPISPMRIEPKELQFGGDKFNWKDFVVMKN